MPSRIFDSLFEEKITGFVSAYRATARHVFYDDIKKELRHTGEFGAYREILVREFLGFFTPSRLNIHNGFLITSLDSISTQIDAVIFDAKSTPLIENGEKQRFFPVETVCAIGEVKSTLTKQQLKEALNKLARNKALREQIQSPVIIRRDRDGDFDPANYAYDQLPSFLICESFNFKFNELHKEVNALYDSDIEARHKHNLILSLKDGLLAYFDSNNKTMMFPEISGRILPQGDLTPKELLKNRFIMPEDDNFSHIKLFCSYMFLLSSSTTILHPEVTDYMCIGKNALMDE
ncbi:DUF6602 domain-containing protein [Aeromonas bestiarum]|uniref:DUF6602 domain-containing protein n=1 Tax=Aeromonas bestiarum TaxID=105751 RepID=UPI003D207E62